MVDELHFSDALRERCCERCHCAAVSRPGDMRVASTRRASTSSTRRAQPSPYTQLFERVYRRLSEQSTTFLLDDGVMLGYCPACSTGTISLQLLGSFAEPRLRINHGCSDGCSAELIARQLQ